MSLESKDLVKMELCDMCDDLGQFNLKFMNDDHTEEEFFFCQEHYGPLIDDTPIELLEVMMNSPVVRVSKYNE